MSSRRFKTIILLMLVAVNLCLLAAAMPVYGQKRLRRSAMADDLQALLEQHGIQFEAATLRQTLSQEQTLYLLELSYSNTAEHKAVNALLPGARADYTSPYQSRWVSAAGSCTAALSGAFSATFSAPLEADPQALLDAMGFDAAAVQRGVRTVTVWQRIAGARMLTPLRLSLEDDRVAAVEGCFLLYEGTPLRVSREAGCSAADALVAFLASRDELGWVGSAVNLMEHGYIPSESTSAIRLTPVWRIVTDTAVYEVDGMTRTVYLVE